MAFQDIYPEGHQGGVGIIQHGVRVASNGDLRLEPTPGQWQPVPKQINRDVDGEAGRITTWLQYPDPDKNRTGFNPIEYPDLELGYSVVVSASGDAVQVIVNLDKPLPDDWVGRVGFNLELFPPEYFGKGWYLGGESGVFPRQPNGPVHRDASGEMQALPFATGPTLVLAPESPERRMVIDSETADLELLDGRHKHNNGWFVVRSAVPAGATTRAIVWRIAPNAVPGWRYKPVVQVSQVGYHPTQSKRAVIELDANDSGEGRVELVRADEDGHREIVRAGEAAAWPGEFLRYNYRIFDFSDVEREGVYTIRYRDSETHPFRIAADVYSKDAWQPTLDYFLPVQMCHMRVEEQYRVWHGVCHLDDARMAPADSNHFDGYVQMAETLSPFPSGETVPGLNAGGWHDAGDDDLRIESQADEVYVLASMYELFGVDHDNTTILQDDRLVRIHQPDGRNDLLQQVEHGVLTVLGGYEALGRFYRGIIVPTLQQYVLLGDVTNSTDNLFYDPAMADPSVDENDKTGGLGPDGSPRGAANLHRAVERTATHSGVPDDRWVFTERNAGHEYKAIASLAIASRVLRGFNDALAARSLDAAEQAWGVGHDETQRSFCDKVVADVELFLATNKPAYREFLSVNAEAIAASIGSCGWAVGRVVGRIDDGDFDDTIRKAVATQFQSVVTDQKKTPYGVPYEPYIWGAGWGIQRFGVEQYYLHRAFPDIVSAEYMLNAMNFILGVHPGSNVASFASGVGAVSVTEGYGLNRADWSYIPGGVASGTALIRPDFPELKRFPYLWQQAEYVMGGGATHYMFLVLAAEQVLGN
ncbi:MAG: glycoside hydrolase family 9 protein [Bacteroidetes bacterium]|nr:glycoside hydrolase family 9 protein [Bacteroidota bacterium]